MENIIITKINECKSHCRDFLIFENYLNCIYCNLNHKYKTNKGYLIDLKEYEQYKNDLLYQVYKNNKNEYEDEIICKICELISINKSLELKKFEQVQIESYQDLKNKLYNNNEYLLISESLWSNICKRGKENESCIEYYINDSDLYFILKDNTFVYFRNNKNILNKTSYISSEDIKKIETPLNINNDIIINAENKKDLKEANNYEKNDNIIDVQNNENKNNKDKLSNLIKIMLEYYLFERKIKEETKSLVKEVNNSGYLIDKKIINNWKKSVNYEKIKDNFFSKYLQNNISVLKKEQKESILDFMIKNNDKFVINDVQIKSLDYLTIEEFKTFSKTNSFVLINKNIFELMNDKKEIKESPIEYKIIKKIIKFTLKNQNF